MPYVEKALREKLRQGTTPMAVPGDLAYVLTEACLRYRAGHVETFAVWAAILGALEATKLEMYRRALAPYEDRKMAENGDVFSEG